MNVLVKPEALPSVFACDVHVHVAMMLASYSGVCCSCVNVRTSQKHARTQAVSCVAGDRKSKRARKGRAPIKVSADDKVRDLKLKIVQTLNVHPENALIHVFREGHWQVLGDDIDARLAGIASMKLGSSADCHNAAYGV